MKKDYFDLNSPLMVDTYLTVKYEKMVHYNIPKLKRNGEARTYGDLYHFYTTKPNFRMAMGYIRYESECGNYWQGLKRWFYFDKNNMPYMVDKSLDYPLILKKNTVLRG